MNDWKTKAERVGARRAHRPGRHAELHHRLAVFEDAARGRAGKFVGVHRRRVGELAALAEGDEMVAARRRACPSSSSPALEEMEAGRAIEVVLHVVLARFHSSFTGAPTCLRDPGRLGHKVVAQPPAEAAADARHVDGDVALGECRASRPPAWRRAPGSCVGAQNTTLPSWKCAVQFCGSRLMCGEERIGIGGFDDMRGALER